MKRKSKSTTLNDSPMAIASDGSILMNFTHLFAKPEHIGAFIQARVDAGDEVFVGIVVPRRLHGEVLDDVDAVLADTVGRIGVELQRPRRR